MDRSVVPADLASRPVACAPCPPPAADGSAPAGVDPTHAAWRAAIEHRLDALLPDGPDLRAAMREAALAPGKRLRPLLAMTATLELGADPGTALDAGCALELVHAASLALDDLPCMDDARLRRGRPALHVARGEDVAILASVSLLARAFGIVAGLRDVEPPVRAALAATLAECIGPDGLAGGQLDDLRAAVARRGPAAARRCNERKTGAAFVAAVDIAAALARAPAARRERLRTFARHLGCAFQLRDDLLDATASALHAGKDTGRDAGKRTLVGLLGVERAAREMRAHLAAARRAAGRPDARSGRAARPLARFLDASFGPELRAMGA